MEDIKIFGMYPEIFGIKLGVFILAMALAFVVQRILLKVVDKAVVVSDHLPAASILENLVRIAVWATAVLLVLQPVFGVEPSGFIAALGVTSVAISFGMQDTIKNLIGGFILMFGKVVQPGDFVTIAGVSGTVTDVTMRHTVVENRSGERILIPNSVLNTSSVIRLPSSIESRSTIEFTMDAGHDPDMVAKDILQTVSAAAGDALRDDMEPVIVAFDSVTPYGVKGCIYFYLKPGVPFTGVKDRMVRSIACKNYFSLAGAKALDGSAGEPLSA